MSLYSNELQNVMERIPKRILRIGMMVIFLIMITLLIGSYFFKYSEIVSCPIVLTTINPPLELYAKTTGKIEHLFVKEHEQVKAGQILAAIENTAHFEAIVRLNKELEFFEGNILWDSIISQKQPSKYSLLGEIQNGYIRFYRGWMNFHYYIEQNYLPLKIELLKTQIKKQEDVWHTLNYRQKLQHKDFQLAEKQYQRDSVFFSKYKDAISLVDYEKKIQTYLQSKSSYINFCSSVSEAESNILKQKENVIDLQIQHENEINTFRLELDESYRLLKEMVNQWSDKYIIISKIDGLATFTGYWSESQTVNSGDRIVTIVPQEKQQILGRAIINMAGIGKVEKGQQVNIKLTGFPFMEFGILRGVISTISLVPEKDKGYIAEILLTEGMESSYQEHLKFIPNIEGIAEIITKKERLLSKLINPLKFKIHE